MVAISPFCKKAAHQVANGTLQSGDNHLTSGPPDGTWEGGDSSP